MIQSDDCEPLPFSTVGDLREWLKATDLSDDTPIIVEGDQGGDEQPLIVTATRKWRMGEQGCLVEFLPDGTCRQIDQRIVIIREFSP